MDFPSTSIQSRRGNKYISISINTYLNVYLNICIEYISVPDAGSDINCSWRWRTISVSNQGRLHKDVFWKWWHVLQQWSSVAEVPYQLHVRFRIITVRFLPYTFISSKHIWSDSAGRSEILVILATRYSKTGNECTPEWRDFWSWALLIISSSEPMSVAGILSTGRGMGIPQKMWHAFLLKMYS